MPCKCYHAERNFLGKIGVCWGTKECEACSCGGDESKCDFYEDKRKKATPKTTNADRIRAMTDEEMAFMLAEISCPDGLTPTHEQCMLGKITGDLYPCENCWLEWLGQEAST